MKKVKIAMVGCGRVANHYKKIFDSGVLSDYEIVGFCDKKIELAESFSKYFNANYFDNLDEMLTSSQPDILFVLSPSGLHFEHSKSAIERNIHVLCEKPITMKVNEAIFLKRMAEERDLIYLTAFQNRFNEPIQILQSAIKENKFGKIITSTIRLRWCRYQDYYEDGWHGTWKSDGGVINQQAIHHVDAINWLMGPIKSVNAKVSNRLNKLEAEDTLVAIMEFENGALGTIEATTAARPKDFEASLSVVGEKGIVEIGGIALNKIKKWYFLDSDDSSEEIKNKYSYDVDSGYGYSHGPLIQTVIELILGKIKDSPFIAKPDSAIETTNLIHALYRSFEDQSWVNIKDMPESRKLGK